MCLMITILANTNFVLMIVDCPHPSFSLQANVSLQQSYCWYNASDGKTDKTPGQVWLFLRLFGETFITIWSFRESFLLYRPV